MDIRVAAYGSSVVSTFTNTAGTRATSYVQNAETQGPVNAVGAVGVRPNDQVAEGNGGGYTDSVRGSIVNILA